MVVRVTPGCSVVVVRSSTRSAGPRGRSHFGGPATTAAGPAGAGIGSAGDTTISVPARMLPSLRFVTTAIPQAIQQPWGERNA